MMALTILIVGLAVLSAAATNAEVQRRLLLRGGRWLPSTLKSGLCGSAVMIGILTAYFVIGGIIVRMAD